MLSGIGPAAHLQRDHPLIGVDARRAERPVQRLDGLLELVVGLEFLGFQNDLADLCREDPLGLVLLGVFVVVIPPALGVGIGNHHPGQRNGEREGCDAAQQARGIETAKTDHRWLL